MSLASPRPPSLHVVPTGRATRQRLAIRAAFAQAKRPLGPREVRAIASRTVPNLGIATVYRNLRAMVAQGELIAVSIPGHADRYHPPLPSIPPLLLCSRCDRAHFLPGASPTPALPPLPGFSVSHVALAVHGHCPGPCAFPDTP